MFRRCSPKVLGDVRGHYTVPCAASKSSLDCHEEQIAAGASETGGEVVASRNQSDEKMYSHVLRVRGR